MYPDQERDVYPESDGCAFSQEDLYAMHEQGAPLAEKSSNPKDLIATDKVPLSLVPDTTKVYLALGHLEGNLKYGLVNWRETGVKASVYLDALDRHVAKWKNGEWADPETNVPHLANALACLSIIVDAHECGKLVDDRPKAAPVSRTMEIAASVVKHLRTIFGGKKPIDYFNGGPRQRP